MHYIGVLSFATGVLFSRPMILGYNSAELGILFFLLAAFVSFPAFAKASNKELPHCARIFAADVIFIFAYSSVLAFYSFDIAIKTVIVNISLVISVFIVLNANGRHFRRGIAFSFRLIMLSGIVTATMIDWSDPIHSRYDLIVAEFSVKDRSATEFAYVYFPFSTIPFSMTTEFGVLPRFTFLTIEPGVAVAFIAVWRALEQPQTKSASSAFDAIFVVCLLLTASTSAPLVAGLYFVARAINRDRIRNKFFVSLSVALLAAAASIAFLYAPGFGYYDKLQTHGASFEGRVEWFTGDSTLNRVLRLALVAAHLMIVARLAGRDLTNISPILFIVSVLNVLACSPLYFMCSYALLRRGNGGAAATISPALSTPRRIHPQRIGRRPNLRADLSGCN